MNPLITIAIPTYQRLAYLQEAVASAQAQTYAPIEILISDDGPGAEIGAWVQTVMRRDPRIRYQKTPRNLGLTGNWNFIVDAARGEWLIIIGDDDRLLPECVVKLAELIRPEVSVVFSNHFLIDAAGKRLTAESEQHTRSYERHRLPAGRLVEVENWVWRNSIPLCSTLLRTADARRIRFKEDLNTPELVFLLPLAQERAGFVFRPDYLMEYRTHPQSATASGLWGERLAGYLLSWSASPEAEPEKRKFMAGLLPGAVTRCLLSGDAARARRYLRSPYFTRHSKVTFFQNLCALLPWNLGCLAFRLFFRCYHKGLATSASAR